MIGYRCASSFTAKYWCNIGYQQDASFSGIAVLGPVSWGQFLRASFLGQLIGSLLLAKTLSAEYRPIRESPYNTISTLPCLPRPLLIDHQFSAFIQRRRTIDPITARRRLIQSPSGQILEKRKLFVRWQYVIQTQLEGKNGKK